MNLKLYLEEIMQGQGTDSFGTGKFSVAKVDSIEEYNNICKRVQEARGIITKDALYMQNSENMNVMHDNLVWFLQQRGIVKARRGNSYYDDDVNNFLCIQVGRADKIFLGESYDSEFYQEISEPGTDAHDYSQAYWKVLRNLNIPFHAIKITR